MEQELVLQLGGERVFVLNNKRDYTNLRVILHGDIADQADVDALVEYANSFDAVTVVISNDPNAKIHDISFIQRFTSLKAFLLFGAGEFNDENIQCIPQTITSFLVDNVAGAKKRSLAFISRFQDLEELAIENGQQDFEQIGHLPKLKKLAVRSLTFKDLSPLLAISSTIESLEIRLGGTKNLEKLPEFKNLKYLELWMIKGLEDISPIGKTLSLQNIFLQALKNVTVLPDLSQMANLRRIHLHTMKGITDLSPLATAPALEELVIENVSHYEVNDFLPLKGLKSLKNIGLGLGSFKKAEGVHEVLGVPPASLLEPFVYR